MFWMSLAYIPKSIPNKGRKLCFWYLWKGKRDRGGIPLVKRQTLSKPKNQGSWGLKVLPLFSKALAMKGMWRILSLKDYGSW
jgi:hypothetical protein